MDEPFEDEPFDEDEVPSEEEDAEDRDPPMPLTADEREGIEGDLEDLDRKRRMMETYLELVQRVEVVRFQFPPGFDRLPAVLDELERNVLQP